MIVVIGGSGLIGSKTTAIPRQDGHQVVAASQSAPWPYQSRRLAPPLTARGVIGHG